MDHKLELVEIYNEDQAFVYIGLECPDCEGVSIGIRRWGEGTTRAELIAEAQRQHEISVRYDGRFHER